MALLVSVGLAMVGCVGGIEDPPVPAEGSRDPRPPGPPTAPPGLPTAVAPAPGGACNVRDLPPPTLRRLTKAEYTRALVDLIGTGAEWARSLPDDAFSVTGFDNAASDLVVSAILAERYRDVAEAASAAVLASAERRARVIGCDLAAQTCMESFIRRFGQRAFRRPLEADEVAALRALASAADPEGGASSIVQAVLQSPFFVFRVERGIADPARPGARRLTGPEVVTRLSFLIRGTTPDDSLLALAQEGRLDTADGVRSAAQAMLDGPAGHVGLATFGRQWLRAQDLETAPLTDDLRAAFADEHERFLADFLWSPGAGLRQMLTARHTWVNARLARLYGLPAPSAAWHRVDLTGRQDRGGLLTQGTFLAGQGVDETLAPIRRGVYVRKVLLCSPPPPPPGNIPPLPPDPGGKSIRELLSEHVSSPSCRVCHEQFDPIGFGFERYDLNGVYRTSDDAGRPLTGAGAIAGTEPRPFTGPLELAARLHAMPEVEACAAQHLFRFAQGRMESEHDRCAIAAVTGTLGATDGDLRTAVLALVVSDSFRLVAEGGTR